MQIRGFVCTKYILVYSVIRPVKMNILRKKANCLILIFKSMDYSKRETLKNIKEYTLKCKFSTLHVSFFRCTAENKYLKKVRHSKYGHLSVLDHLVNEEPLAFLPLNMSANYTFVAGGNLTLYCAVSGYPLPAIKWLNGKYDLNAYLSILIGRYPPRQA